MHSRFYARIRLSIGVTATFAAVAALGAIRDNRIVTEIDWSSYRTGLAEARRTHEPLLITLQVPGDGWSAKMNTETFCDPAVMKAAQDFVCVRVDHDTDIDVARFYRIKDYPATVIAQPDGTLLANFRGYIPSDRLVPLLKRFVK